MIPISIRDLLVSNNEYISPYQALFKHVVFVCAYCKNCIQVIDDMWS